LSDIFARRFVLLKSRGRVTLKPIITQALQMGDELHNRHSASSAMFGMQWRWLIKADTFSKQYLPLLLKTIFVHF